MNQKLIDGTPMLTYMLEMMIHLFDNIIGVNLHIMFATFHQDVI